MATLVEETQADELVVADVYEHVQRLRSFEPIAEAAELPEKA